MKKYRIDAKVDANQNDIVNDLKQLGYSVEVNHDDILIGAMGMTFWYEVKNPKLACDTEGRIRANEIKKDQRRILRDWKGHYKIVTSTEEILEDIKQQLRKVFG